MSQWYLSYNGSKLGPMDLEEAIKQAQQNPNGHAWRQGLAEWLPIGSIDELSGTQSRIPGPATPDRRLPPGR